jgi:hypothetical protein
VAALATLHGIFHPPGGGAEDWKGGGCEACQQQPMAVSMSVSAEAVAAGHQQSVSVSFFVSEAAGGAA